MMKLIPNDKDYDALWRINPLAQEQLKSIVLARLLVEKEAELAAVTEPEKVTEKP